MISYSPKTADRLPVRPVWVAFRLHSCRLSEPGIPQGTPDRICLELTLEESQMNRLLQDVLCAVVFGACVTSQARAEDGSSPGSLPSLSVTNGSPATMSVTGTQGAMVIEASTNLTDWTDVTMLFPNSGPGIFIDTEATNYSYRFYRVRTIISAANNIVTVNSVGDLRMLSAVSGNADIGVSCLLYTSPSPRDGLLSRMPSSA